MTLPDFVWPHAAGNFIMQVVDIQAFSVMFAARSIPDSGTIIGGLSPRRIRRGSDRVRSDPPTSPPERPPRRTQADSGGPKKSPPSPPESAADPIGSDRIRHQLADGPPENGRKKLKSKSPRRTKYVTRQTKSATRRTKSAIDKVRRRQSPPTSAR